jgi:hypothetical protein
MGRVVLAKRKRAIIVGAFGRQLLSNLLSGIMALLQIKSLSACDCWWAWRHSNANQTGRLFVVANRRLEEWEATDQRDAR